MLVGAIIALVGTVLYFFLGMPLLTADMKVLLVGGVALLLGPVQFVFGGYLKAAVNALFVVGSFITLVVADLLGKSLLIDLYAVGLIVFLLVVRIQISEWNNRRICLNCESADVRVS